MCLALYFLQIVTSLWNLLAYDCHHSNTSMSTFTILPLYAYLKSLLTLTQWDIQYSLTDCRTVLTYQVQSIRFKLLGLLLYVAIPTHVMWYLVESPKAQFCVLYCFFLFITFICFHDLVLCWNAQRTYISGSTWNLYNLIHIKYSQRNINYALCRLLVSEAQ